jgi:hypothetical protein
VKLPGTVITSARTVQAAAFVSPEPKVSKEAAERYKKRPCLQPGHGNADANRRFQNHGRSANASIGLESQVPRRRPWSGGFAGSILYRSMVGALAQGYATAGADTGHEEGGGRHGVGAPPSGGDCPFWMSWRSRDDGECEGNRKGRRGPNSARILFRRLLRRRAGGTDGSAALSEKNTMAFWLERLPTIGRIC